MRYRQWQWYLRRLRAMSAPEIRYRLSQGARIWLERKRPPRPRFLDENLLPEVFARFRAEEDSKFFFDWENRDRLIHQFSERFGREYQITLNLASKFLQGHYSLWGQEFIIGRPIPWQRDPLTGRDWPSVFWASINTRDAQEVGGVKWVWELNRHHHLVTLAKAFFLSGEERFAEEVCAHLVDWIQTNPPLIGVNWASPLEIAIRLINWVWALAFIRKSSALTDQVFQLVLESIGTQTDHISRHLSAYSSANNHLIGEAAALVFIGLCFPWFSQAQRWRDIGIRLLVRELERQIYSDGVPAEQSTHYLSFVLDFNLLVWRLAELNGVPVPPLWYERFKASCNFIAHLMDESGHVPMIGDSDDGCVVRLDDRPEVNKFCSLLATGAALLQEPIFKTAAGRWDERSHWLLGEHGLARFESLPSLGEGSISSRIFKEGGYCVMRAPGWLVVLDGGPLGYLSTAAHGHGDALNLIVTVHRQQVFVDPGTYAYQEGGKWREFFVGTSAHNTVVVDGHNQSERLGTFLWGRKAQARILRWESTPAYDWAIVQHDGYQLLGVIHQRRVLLHKSGSLLVADFLLGTGEHLVEQWWHLSPDWRVEINGRTAYLTLKEFSLVFTVIEPTDVHLQVHKGEEEPPQGWFSRHYGHKEPAIAICVRKKGLLPVRVVAVLYRCPVSISAEQGVVL